MEFNSRPEDKAKQTEFHTPEYVKTQLKVKNSIQADLIKAIDDLTKVNSSNAERIGHLKSAMLDCKTEAERQIFQKEILRYEDLSDLANKVSETYLILLDIYTYGIYALLTENEWDWRAFARHFYTMLFEHRNTVNVNLNAIIKILKEHVDNVFDIEAVDNAKKAFSSFIEDNSKDAKEIRINVDAHFDGDLNYHLDLIKNLSFCHIVGLYAEYIKRMHEFLIELKPALVEFRSSADSVYHSLVKNSLE